MDETLRLRQQNAPVDEASARALSARGLVLRRFANDGAEFAGWFEAMERGFLEAAPAAVKVEATQQSYRGRRLIGVVDQSGPEPRWPVSTFATWVGELSVPGGVLASCAVSDVSVSPTHRRRGIARAMMEGELRTAASLGIPVASLTATEAPLYGRYGFGPAAYVARAKIDTRRAGWAGPKPAGRVDFISRERWRQLAPALFERVRAAQPGEFDMPEGHWDQFAGTRADAEKPEGLRAVQYTDADGAVRGLALYRATANEQDYALSRVDISLLFADGDDAYAALWRFFVEMDLIHTVSATQISVDEPVLWMLADRRAAEVTVYDHHYVRILDVPAALQGRRYRHAGRMLLHVEDPLGIAGGRFVMTVDEHGVAEVGAASARATASVTLTAGVTELSALLLGQVSARTLAAAGRITSSDPDAVDAVFRWNPPARLSYWY